MSNNFWRRFVVAQYCDLFVLVSKIIRKSIPPKYSGAPTSKMSRGYLLHLGEEERLKAMLKINRSLLRSASNPLDLPHNYFVANFRLTKPQFLKLCGEVFPLLQRRRNSAVCPQLKVLAAVSFYANGAYQKNIGAYYHLGLSQTTVHDCLCEVTEALNSIEILRRYVKFPMTQEERGAVKRK